jgi:hypothetical protein
VTATRTTAEAGAHDAASSASRDATAAAAAAVTPASARCGHARHEPRQKLGSGESEPGRLQPAAQQQQQYAKHVCGSALHA